MKTHYKQVYQSKNCLEVHNLKWFFVWKLINKEQKYLFSNKYLKIIVIVLAHNVLVKQKGKKNNSLKEFERKKILNWNVYSHVSIISSLRYNKSTWGNRVLMQTYEIKVEKLLVLYFFCSSNDMILFNFDTLLLQTTGTCQFSFSVFIFIFLKNKWMKYVT